MRKSYLGENRTKRRRQGHITDESRLQLQSMRIDCSIFMQTKKPTAACKPQRPSRPLSEMGNPNERRPEIFWLKEALEAREGVQSILISPRPTSPEQPGADQPGSSQIQHGPSVCRFFKELTTVNTIGAGPTGRGHTTKPELAHGYPEAPTRWPTKPRCCKTRTTEA